MRGGHDRRRDVADALFADEVGIEYGVYGDYRLKSAYQPAFAQREGQLVPVAVSASLQPQLRGRPVPAADFLEAVAPADRLFVESLCRRLHLGNYRNIGVEGLDLLFIYNPKFNDHAARALAEIRLMARHLDEFDLNADMLICEITEKVASDDALLKRLVRELRRNGLRIAVGEFGASHSTEARLDLLEPDMVKVDGDWFARLCRQPAAARLFGPLVSVLHQRGAKVLVEGIEESSQLKLALEGGADLLQGLLLAPPALAGTLFRTEPLALERLLKDAGKVVPLFGGAAG